MPYRMFFKRKKKRCFITRSMFVRFLPICWVKFKNKAKVLKLKERNWNSTRHLLSLVVFNNLIDTTREIECCKQKRSERNGSFSTMVEDLIIISFNHSSTMLWGLIVKQMKSPKKQFSVRFWKSSIQNCYPIRFILRLCNQLQIVQWSENNFCSA